VGALARDLLLHYAHGFKIERATTDVDFALAVDSWGEFSAARDALLASKLFTPFLGALHKLQHSNVGSIDLIPFGAIERSDGTIAWPPEGNEIMAVIGYSEAADSAITLSLPGHQTISAVSLPMLAVLKVLAWRAWNHLTQGKDAMDLRLILRSYLEAGNLDRLYSDFSHVITDAFDFEPNGAWLLGHDARVAIRKHSARFNQVIGTAMRTSATKRASRSSSNRPERSSICAIKLLEDQLGCFDTAAVTGCH